MLQISKYKMEARLTDVIVQITHKKATSRRVNSILLFPEYYDHLNASFNVTHDKAALQLQPRV